MNRACAALHRRRPCIGPVQGKVDRSQPPSAVQHVDHRSGRHLRQGSGPERCAERLTQCTHLGEVDLSRIKGSGGESPSVHAEPVLELRRRLQAVDRARGIGVHGADELDRDRLIGTDVLLHVLTVAGLASM